MYYYMIKSIDGYGNTICTSIIETQSENRNPDYTASTKEENEIALDKMWDGNMWVEDVNAESKAKGEQQK